MPQATRRLSRHVLSLLMALAGAGGPCHRAAAQPGYFAKAPVTGETDLDWAYPLVGHSPVDPPRELLAGYRSEATRYEFFGPAQSGAAPLLIFVSPKDRPMGWMFFEETCRTRGILFAGLHDMGNGRPAAHRVRAVLDVLSDLRERFPVDPDRTYLAGFSGGAQVACVAALALPEYFGGVLCFGHASRPPQEPWLLDRVRGRLSMAIICGARDQAATLAENVYVPLWEGVGARVRLEVVRGMGHTMPAPGVCDAALAWAEEGAAARRAWADAHPASRIADAPTRDAWAERALGDAEQQLARAQPAEIDAGLRQLEGIASRWQGTSASRRAEELLAEYDSRPDQPWLAVRTQRDQSSRQLEAEASSALAENSRPSTEAEGFPLARARFNVVGDVTLQEGIELMRAALARIGYELRADEEALRAAGAPLDVVQRPRLRAASFAEVDRRFFRRAGVRTVRTGRVIEVLPRTDSRPAEAPGDPPARRPDKTPPAASAPGAAGR